METLQTTYSSCERGLARLITHADAERRGALASRYSPAPYAGLPFASAATPAMQVQKTPSKNARGVIISGTQVFFALALALLSGMSVIWVFVRYWIFAR
jgi:hypothetical protein